MEKKITDTSVQTGLQIEANGKPDKLLIAGADTGTNAEDNLEETDADELVHEQSAVIKPADEEQDMDELVHSIPASKTVMDNNEVDPDDVVHQK